MPLVSAKSRTRQPGSPTIRYAVRLRPVVVVIPVRPAAVMAVTIVIPVMVAVAIVVTEARALAATLTRNLQLMAPVACLRAEFSVFEDLFA